MMEGAADQARRSDGQPSPENAALADQPNDAVLWQPEHPSRGCMLLRQGVVAAVKGSACLEPATHARQDGSAWQFSLQVIVADSPATPTAESSDLSIPTGACRCEPVSAWQSRGQERRVQPWIAAP